MSSKSVVLRPKDKKFTPKYGSLFGSHKSMIKEDFGRVVVCQDDLGEYLTERSRLDNGEADPNRWATTETRENKLMEFREYLTTEHLGIS